MKTTFILAGGNDRKVPDYGDRLNKAIAKHVTKPRILSCFFSSPAENWPQKSADWQQWFKMHFAQSLAYDYAKLPTFLEQIDTANYLFPRGHYVTAACNPPDAGEYPRTMKDRQREETAFQRHIGNKKIIRLPEGQFVVIEKADRILNSLLAKKLVTGGQFLVAPARFLWKGEIENMAAYITITSYTTQQHKQAIIEDARRTTAEEFPMITFLKIDDLNNELKAWIEETVA